MLTTGICSSCGGNGCDHCGNTGELVRCTSCYDWVPLGDGVHGFEYTEDEEFICRACLCNCQVCEKSNAATWSALEWDQPNPVLLRTASLVRLCDDCLQKLYEASELVPGTTQQLTDAQKGK